MIIREYYMDFDLWADVCVCDVHECTSVMRFVFWCSLSNSLGWRLIFIIDAEYVVDLYFGVIFCKRGQGFDTLPL